MSKAQGLFKENQMGRKPAKIDLSGVDHFQLFDSRECVTFHNVILLERGDLLF